MSDTFYHSLIVVEPRRGLGELICQTLQSKNHETRARRADGPEDAIENAFRLTLRQPQSRPSAERSVLFFLGGNSYLEAIESYRRIYACFPRAGYILLDDAPRKGCGLTADRIGLQGYFSLCDNLESWLRCLSKLLRGKPTMTPQGEEYLDVDGQDLRLVSRHHLRNHQIHSLSDKEWFCFRHLISGGKLPELARMLRLQERSAKNLKYRLMKKLDVPQFIDVLWIAHEWGFLRK